ncbi:hypothetical protein ACFFGV_09260 [Pontibacillus salicampi]|uniref:DUF3953 domain-containing protein n=1 Tax=Pontibacillus salicampi TaxID=1449801 RepID=A0ABV6LMW1_9BACI
MNEWVRIGLIVAMCGTQYGLSSRRNPALGIIVPIIFVSVMTWILMTGQMEMVLYSVLLVVGLLFLAEEWSRGRKEYKEKTTQELHKMKSQDF